MKFPKYFKIMKICKISQNVKNMPENENFQRCQKTNIFPETVNFTKLYEKVSKIKRIFQKLLLLKNFTKKCRKSKYYLKNCQISETASSTSRIYADFWSVGPGFDLKTRTANPIQIWPSVYRNSSFQILMC